MSLKAVAGYLTTVHVSHICYYLHTCFYLTIGWDLTLRPLQNKTKIIEINRKVLCDLEGPADI